MSAIKNATAGEGSGAKNAEAGSFDTNNTPITVDLHEAQRPASAYLARPIKRGRRTKARVDQLEQQIIDVLAVDQPQSVRHVFYRMTDPRLPEPVEKSDNGYNQVQDRLKKMRESGRIPYGWIVDATRRGYFVNTYSGAGDFVRRMSQIYRGDLWVDSPYRCEVWVESRSLASVVLDTCQELSVSLYPAAGFASMSFIYDVATTINADDDGRPLHVFYIGDYDPAGELIDKKIEAGLRQHLDDDVDMRFERIGITPEQIKFYDLPTKPRKPGDKRSLHVKETVEAESMPARILRNLLRERIEELLPANALAVTKVAEESERDYLMSIAGIMLGDRS